MSLNNILLWVPADKTQDFIYKYCGIGDEGCMDSTYKCLPVEPVHKQQKNLASTMNTKSDIIILDKARIHMLGTENKEEDVF